MQDVVQVSELTHRSFDRIPSSPLSKRSTKRDNSQKKVVSYQSFANYYDVKRLLGKGAFGKVALATNKLTK